MKKLSFLIDDVFAFSVLWVAFEDALKRPCTGGIKEDKDHCGNYTDDADDHDNQKRALGFLFGILLIYRSPILERSSFLFQKMNLGDF